MNIYEAINLLDTDFNDEYGKIVIGSRERNLSLVNSKYGICQCTRDWPQGYTLKIADFKVNDWVVENIPESY